MCVKITAVTDVFFSVTLSVKCVYLDSNLSLVIEGSDHYQEDETEYASGLKRVIYDQAK